MLSIECAFIAMYRSENNDYKIKHRNDRIHKVELNGFYVAKHVRFSHKFQTYIDHLSSSFMISQQRFSSLIL